MILLIIIVIHDIKIFFYLIGFSNIGVNSQSFFLLFNIFLLIALKSFFLISFLASFIILLYSKIGFEFLALNFLLEEKFLLLEIWVYMFK